jgi:hypothetical protein
MINNKIKTMIQHILVCIAFIGSLIAYTNLIQKNDNETKQKI